MIYLSPEDYKVLGGKADLTDFPRLERLAEKKLDYWTMNRIVEPDDDIRLCMTLIVDALDTVGKSGGAVSSVSNDGVSVTYADPKTDEEVLSDVYDQVVEILPYELVSRAVDV